MGTRGCRQWGEGFAVSLSNRLCTRAMFKINDLTLRLEEVSPSLERSLERLSDLDFSENSFISYENSFYLLVRSHSHANSEGNEGNLVEK